MAVLTTVYILLGNTQRAGIQEGVSEQLKADNQMEWVGMMNNIRQRATETINHDIIYN